MWVKGEIFRNLDEAQAAARGELDRNAQRSLFNRLDWFRRTHDQAPPPGRPLIVRARAEGSDCWLFLIEKAGHATALASWYTLAFEPVFSGEPRQAVKSSLLIACARRLAKHVASIALAPLPPESADLVCRSFDRARWITRKREATVNWTVSTTDMSFADYWAQRPGELRSTVKRKCAKYGVDTHIHTDFDDKSWDAYAQIYAASWKPEEGSMAFLRDMAVHEGAAGALRLGIATIDGVAVAAQLWTVENGHAIIHKLAHLATAKEQSPGSILTAAMFDHVITHDRVALVDFGTGDDRYKRDWMDRCTPLYAVRLFNPRRPAGLAGAAKSWAAALVGRDGTR